VAEEDVVVVAAGVAEAGGSMSVIRMEGITKVYEIGEMQVHALRGVSLTVETGEFVAIMGPSGSGKSTLMHILGCLDVPTAGTYELDEVEVGTLEDDDLAHIRSSKIGFVFQQYNLLSRATALENVELPLIYSGVEDREYLAIKSLERVGLGDRLRHYSNQLSGGQQQRVAIARALVNNPAIILADEPTGNLASDQSEEIMALFQELNEHGITVVMITHEADIGDHAKRIIRVRDGRVVADDPVHERLYAEEIIKTMPRLD
jgi:putative ABC transport system ATP-binding protein